jgi:hypothetical protein
MMIAQKTPKWTMGLSVSGLAALLLFSASLGSAQTINPPASSSLTVPPILGQSASAWAGSQQVSSVQIAGTATWHAGSFEDSGTATLTASSSGAAQMQLDLSTKGAVTESQQAIGPTNICQYTGSDGKQNTQDALNCWRAAVWFLPSISLQPTSIPSGVALADLGTATAAKGSYRHLQGSLALLNLPSTITTRLAEESVTDIALDPQTLLPMSLSYTVHPDSGAQMVTVPIRVQFSNYRVVSGVEIPFLIQRYVNGSLQLEIAVTAAQIN